LGRRLPSIFASSFVLKRENATTAGWTFGGTKFGSVSLSSFDSASAALTTSDVGDRDVNFVETCHGFFLRQPILSIRHRRAEASRGEAAQMGEMAGESKAGLELAKLGSPPICPLLFCLAKSKPPGICDKSSYLM
jgi:hypothetical protein